MPESFERLYRVYGRIVTGFAVVAGLITFAVMWMVDADVFMRKFFNAPLQGSFELTEAGLVLIVFLAIAFTQYRRGHIRVTLLTRHLPRGVQHGLYIVVLLVGALFFAWCTYAAVGNTILSYNINEREWGMIPIAIWPEKSAIAVGTLLLCLQFLLDAIRLYFVARGSLPPVGDDP